MSIVPGHVVWVDGPEVLYELLDGLPAGEFEGQELTTTTYLGQRALPWDLATKVPAGHVAVCVYRGGWTNDAERLDGHDSVIVDVYAPTADMSRAVQRAFEILLVGNYFDTQAGFVDDVELATRFRDVPSPADTYAQTSAAFRVIARPD